MRGWFYFLATLAGLFGTLALLRTFEQLLVGEGFRATQFAIGVVGITLAVLWIKRARAAGR